VRESDDRVLHEDRPNVDRLSPPGFTFSERPFMTVTFTALLLCGIVVDGRMVW